MTTIIYMPQSSTETHRFVAVTVAGRSMSIEVEASKDIDSEAVLRDLAESLHSKSSVKPDEEVSALGAYLWGILFIVICWAFAGAIGFGVYVLGLIADFYTPYDQPFFSDGLPIIGGYRFGVGLFRLYVLSLPTMFIVWFIISVWSVVKGCIKQNKERKS
ncbi:hypothetical protein WAQ86_004775 [Salmonella enterica]